jgi:predicted phage tail protein
VETHLDIRTEAGRQPPDGDELSLPELIGRMTTDVSTLLRKEIELAKVEMKTEAVRAGRGAGALGATAVTGLLALLLLSFAAAWGLAELIPTGFAFLVVGGAYLLIAGILFLIGRKQISAVDPVPQQTVETLKEDVAWARERMS